MVNLKVEDKKVKAVWRLDFFSKFYSILYYNAVVWLTPDLKSESKHDLLSVSALALRSCLYLAHCNEISFINIHKLHKKCTPEQITNYQLSLNLYKTINQKLILYHKKFKVNKNKWNKKKSNK